MEKIQISKLTNFKPVGNHKRKKQIVLTHTSRYMKDYVRSLKYRLNGNNTKLPHYIISKGGEITQILPPETYSNYIDVPSYNKTIIVISLENLGWLRKNPLVGGYINWIGNIYKDKVHERKWRGYFFWQPYSVEQMTTLSILINKLCMDFNIPKTFIGHNVKVDDIERFNGIVTYSNYNKERTDLNPSFNFDEFIKIMKND